MKESEEEYVRSPFWILFVSAEVLVCNALVWFCVRFPFVSCGSKLFLFFFVFRKRDSGQSLDDAGDARTLPDLYRQTPISCCW